VSVERLPRRRSRVIRGLRYRVALRTFLNKPGFHGKATLIASVEDTSRIPAEELRFEREPDTYLSISDCSSECRLEIEITSREAQRNSLYKLNTLIGGLERFREALSEEIELYNERKRNLWREW
jgi:hypothetical protein